MANRSDLHATRWLVLQSVPDGQRSWWVMVSHQDASPSPASSSPRVHLDLERAARSGRGANHVKHEACRKWLGNLLQSFSGVHAHWEGVWSLPDAATYDAFLMSVRAQTKVTVLPRWSLEYSVRRSDDAFRLLVEGDGKRAMDAGQPADFVRLNIKLEGLDWLADDGEEIAQRQTERIGRWLTKHVEDGGGIFHPAATTWWLPNEDAYWAVLAKLRAESKIEPSPK